MTLITTAAGLLLQVNIKGRWYDSAFAILSAKQCDTEHSRSRGLIGLAKTTEPVWEAGRAAAAKHDQATKVVSHDNDTFEVATGALHGICSRAGDSHR